MRRRWIHFIYSYNDQIVHYVLFAEQSAYSSSSKSVEVSETSGVQNSFTFSDTKEVMEIKIQFFFESY